jgi:poly-gamma-glutamate synthesis protein (capsule biosynthesis protein)
MDYQREVGRALVEAGCDLILGHHPHRVHGVEYHRGKPVLYSLGNFVFEPLPPAGNTPHLSFRGRMTAANVYGAMRREGVLVDARLRGDRLEPLLLRPLVLDDGGYPTLRPERAEQLATLLRDLSPAPGARFRAVDGAVVVGPP